MEKNINLDKAVLDYIIANRLLNNFDKLEVYDIYKYRGSENIGQFDYFIGQFDYFYDRKRIYDFKIGNLNQKLTVDLGNFSVPVTQYGTSTYKELWFGKDKNSPSDVSELINFLRSDIHNNPNIIAFLANLLKVDIEKALEDHEKILIQKQRNEILDQINEINVKIHKLERDKTRLQNELKSLDSTTSKEDEDNNSLKPILK